MADSSRTKRRRRALVGSAAAALALSLSLVPGSATADPPDTSPAAAPAAPWETKVMTRNLYLGADLMPVITVMATNPMGVPLAAAGTWARVQATRPQDRMAAIADEIVAQDPAVVGLQEVTRWETYSSYDPATRTAANPTVQYDFLELLLDALAAKGADYREVSGATSHNFASGPIPMATTTGLGAVAMSDRDVIIRRADVLATNPRNGSFDTIIAFTLADGSTIPVHRGWGSVDVRDKGRAFRFVNAHLEAFGVPGGVDEEVIRVAQVQELLAAHEWTPLPTVYVGDYNSAAPDGDAYELLVGSVGSDAWLVAPDPSAPDGDTCCFDAFVMNPADPLTERIDLVLHGPGIQTTSTTLIGDQQSDMVGQPPRWPSDHAGLTATLEIGHAADRRAHR